MVTNTDIINFLSTRTQCNS